MGYYARHLVWHSQAQCQFIVTNASKSRLLIHNRCIQGTSKSLSGMSIEIFSGKRHVAALFSYSGNNCSAWTNEFQIIFSYLGTGNYPGTWHQGNEFWLNQSIHKVIVFQYLMTPHHSWTVHMYL